MASTAEKSSTQSSATSDGAPAGSTTPTGGKSTGALPKVVGNAPKAAPQPSLGQRMLGMLRGSRVSPPANKPAAPKPTKPAPVQRQDYFPPGFWRKRLMGMLLLIVGMFVILYGLQYVTLAFPQLGLLATIAPSKANVPLLSGISYQLLIMLVLFVGLYLLTYRLGLFPNPNTPSAAAQRSSGGGATPAAVGAGRPGSRKPANATPGIGEHRTRADRRFAAERAAERAARAREAKLARENSGMRGMLNRAFKREAAAENATKTAARKTTATKTTAKAATVGVGAAKPTKAPAVAAATKAPTTSDHDEMYERVKADQRMRRRRDGKH